jgi:hypothetical protein
LAWGCGLDSTGSGQGPGAGSCECGDEPSGPCATELVSMHSTSLALSRSSTSKPTEYVKQASVTSCRFTNR